MTEEKAPPEKLTTRQFLKSLKPGTTILRVYYRRRGGPLAKFGVYDGFESSDDTYFRMKTGPNGTDIIDTSDVIEIREVPLVAVVALLSEHEEMRNRVLNSCPIIIKKEE